MNVFILCTGRCGSTNFIRACEHLSNFTAGHETQASVVGSQRLCYPNSHIEADNRLSWLLGRLDNQYGDGAYYVHLRRDPEEVARSVNMRWSSTRSIIKAYGDGILMGPHDEGSLDLCRDYVATVTANIDHFLRDKSHTMTVRIEEIQDNFPRFLDWIGAEGDHDAAMAEWQSRHNASRPPRPPEPPPTILRRVRRRMGKIYRATIS